MSFPIGWNETETEKDFGGRPEEAVYLRHCSVCGSGGIIGRFAYFTHEREYYCVECGAEFDLRMNCIFNPSEE